MGIGQRLTARLHKAVDRAAAQGLHAGAHRVPRARLACPCSSSARPQQQQETPQQARQRLLATHPPYQFHIKGVSFDGRQEQLRKLAPGQALQLLPEPHNPHDAHAVAVTTLRGAGLGYVPRELTRHLPHLPTFGALYSVGATAAGLLGASVCVRAAVRPLTLQLPPQQLAGGVLDLSSALHPRDWHRISSAAIKLAGGRCAISSAAADPLKCHELWLYDDVAHVITLLGVMPLCPELSAVKGVERKGRLELGTGAAAAVCKMLREMNVWSARDVDTYVDAAIWLQQSRSSARWRLDLTWLKLQGVAVPHGLQRWC